ncbi:MAG: hypothetical protein IPK79_04275 [Vampirovibrionales bacterium]|nr:hypothetical protein [Vampirovibrionales bacterium]
MRAIAWLTSPLLLIGGSMAVLGAASYCPIWAASPDERPSEAVFDSITQSCCQQMARNVVSNPVAAAYCYCYAETLTQQLSQADFERMGQSGPTDRDRRIFQAAHRRCGRPAGR